MVAVTDLEAKAQSGNSPNKETSPKKVDDGAPADPKAEAYAALGAGKRHLLVADIAAAVSSLGLACELFSVQFGETAPECSEVYFYYGKALLELARLESGVLGNALDGVPEEEAEGDDSQIEDPEKLTEDEKNDVEDKVDDALEENFKTCEDKSSETNGVHAKESEKPEEGEEEGEEGEENGENMEATDAEPEKGDAESVGSSEEAKDEKEEEDKEEAEDDDDPTNLQLAWEMLELAKVVYMKQIESATAEEKPELEDKLCETYMILGEVSLENENYPQSEEDLLICLQMRQNSQSSDSRCIAETHYQLGIAQGFHMKYEEAIESLNAAISVLETRINNLKNKTESSNDIEKEVSELEALIPDIKEKITDTKEMKAENLRKMREASGFPAPAVSGSGEGASGSSSAKPISSIAIKRKGPEDDVDPKKPKV